MPRNEGITHTVEISYQGDGRGYWECDCGRAGSAREDDVDLASDDHIDYEAGDRRVDRYPAR